MWFYKIDGVLDGFTFPEDRGTRSRAAQEFQPKQTLFSKKLQGKCYITVSQIKGGRITLAAVSLESYNILARCREFLREPGFHRLGPRCAAALGSGVSGK